MKKINLLFFIISFFAITATYNVYPQDNTSENLGIPGPINFDGTNYYLLQAVKQNDVTYYQEYVPESETSDNYNQMLICKLFLTDWTAQEVAENKANQIEQLKNTDTISTYRMFKSKDVNDYIIDYFLGEYTTDNKLSGVEYYVYRYKRIKLENDSEAIFAYAYTRHSNGKNTENFLQEVNSQKNHYVGMMIATKLPTIKLQPTKVTYIKDPDKEKGYSSDLTESQQKAKADFLAGTLLNNSKQYLQAIEKFKKAIEIDSTGNCGTQLNGAAYGELGDCYSSLGDYSNAIIYFDKGIQINKYYPLTYLHKANMLLIQNKSDEALTTLDSLISNDPNEPIAYAQRGLLYDSTQTKMALADFKMFLTLTNEQNQEETLKDMVKIIQESISDIEKRHDK
jgi:tetratricopeptide (TPR) repeat protein